MLHHDDSQLTTAPSPNLPVSQPSSARFGGSNRIAHGEFRSDSPRTDSMMDSTYHQPATGRAPVPAPSRPVNRLNSPLVPTIGSDDSGQSKKTLHVLREALLAAAQCNRNVWDFAVEISELTEAGIAKHVLRKLVCLGFIEHRREVPTTSSSRSFLPEIEIVLSNRSCFVLKHAGLREATRLAYGDKELPINEPHFKGQPSVVLPVWDGARRELRLGDQVVKRFKWPAPNQERVLQAFQEQNWMKKIDDPLPPDDQVCPKRRLHDTIKCLNRNQLSNVIKFRGDGTGRGVFWEIQFDDPSTDSTQSVTSSVSAPNQKPARTEDARPKN